MFFKKLNRLKINLWCMRTVSEWSRGVPACTWSCKCGVCERTDSQSNTRREASKMCKLILNKEHWCYNNYCAKLLIALPDPHHKAIHIHSNRRRGRTVGAGEVEASFEVRAKRHSQAFGSKVRGASDVSRASQGNREYELGFRDALKLHIG